MAVMFKKMCRYSGWMEVHRLWILTGGDGCGFVVFFGKRCIGVLGLTEAHLHPWLDGDKPIYRNTVIGIWLQCW